MQETSPVRRDDTSGRNAGVPPATPTEAGRVDDQGRVAGPGDGTSEPTSAGADLSPGQFLLVPLSWRGVLIGTSIVSALVTIASYIPTRWSGGGLFYGGGEWHHLFDVALETSVTTAWSTILMVTAALLCLACWWVARRTRSGPAWPWAVLALGLGLFALDEAAMIHERLYLVVERLSISRPFAYIWLVIGIPLAILVVAVVVVCARHLPRTARNLLITGVLVFFAGAIGLELLTGELAARAPEIHHRFLSELIHVEEFLELIGIGIAVCAPLSALRATRQHVMPLAVDVETR